MASDQFEEQIRLTQLILATHRTLPAKLSTIVDLAERLVPGCDAAGVALVLEGAVTSAAVSNRVTLEADVIQYETGEGPCLAAIADSLAAIGG